MRKVRVEKEDYRPFSTAITVAGGAAVTLAVKLEKQLHDGHLAVTAGADDRISVDGKVVGKGWWEGALPSGGHSLHVEAKGMRAYDFEVTIQDRQTRTLTVTLDAEKKEFPMWLLVTAGGVAAAGLAVGGYFSWICWAPHWIQRPPRAASAGGFGSSTRPSSSPKKRRPASSQPGGAAS